MIGRIDSTLNRWRPTPGRSAALVAIAVLIAVGGSSSTMLAQTPPRVKIEGVVPSGGAEPQKPASPATPADLLPDLDNPPSNLPPPVPQGARPENPTPSGSPATSPRARLDKQVRPADASTEANTGPLPPSEPAPDGSPPADKAAASPGDSDPFFLRTDRMMPGKQRVQLTVDVQASPIMNLNKEATVKLVVFNESDVDAAGVSLVYQLPESLKLNSSVPQFTEVPGRPQYQWSKPMLPAGSAWTVILKVTPISTKPAEHAAVVTVKTGSKANSTIQEPKLKVEATCSPGRVLKGEQVKFQITVRNPGTGPARNVIVQARLTSGLKCGSDDIVEQTIPLINPGEGIPLESLTVDTVDGGEQSCTVDVRSADVIPVPADQRVVTPVEVTKPDLTVKIDGQAARFTGQTTEYKVTVHNPGTAPTRQVMVVVSLPKEGGKLIAKPPGARWILESRKLVWSIPQIEPGQPIDMTFNYATTSPGLYRANVEASSSDLRVTDSFTTDVSGIAVLDLKLEQEARVIDVNKNNIYDITIKNVGTKEATKLALRGTLPKNLKVVKAFNVENGKFAFNEQTGEFLFPVIERLAVGQTITLSLEVQAVASGPGGCHVFLAHAEMATDEAPVEDVISTTITGNGRAKNTTKKP